MDAAHKLGQKIVEYVNAGKDMQGLDEFYHEDAVSLEPMPGPRQRCEGVEAIKKKHEWWNDNATVHSSSATGPFPLGNKFAVIFDMDVTMAGSKQRDKMKEVGLYTVENGKIICEEFMYPTQ